MYSGDIPIPSIYVCEDESCKDAHIPIAVLGVLQAQEETIAEDGHAKAGKVCCACYRNIGGIFVILVSVPFLSYRARSSHYQAESDIQCIGRLHMD